MARVLNFLALAGIAAFLASPANAQEATAGQKVFAKCAVCHGIGDTKKPIGPNLNGVIGRTAGTEPEFLAKKGAGYSKAMIAAGRRAGLGRDPDLRIHRRSEEEDPRQQNGVSRAEGRERPS